MCAMTHAYVCHDSFIYVCHDSFIYVCHASFVFFNPCVDVEACVRGVRDESICVP